MLGDGLLPQSDKGEKGGKEGKGFLLTIGGEKKSKESLNPLTFWSRGGKRCGDMIQVEEAARKGFGSSLK